MTIEKTIQGVAVEAAGWFETARRATGDTETGPREDGEPFVRVKDGAPEWVTELVREAHGEMLPDDWRYACISAAVDWIAENDGDPDDSAHEFADQYVDVYTSALFAWAASHAYPVAYCDDAAEEYGVPPAEDGIVRRLQIGQYAEARDVFELVRRALEAEAEKRQAAGERLEYLRGELRAERISYGELADLQDLVPYMGDVELLEAAGGPEHDDDDDEAVV